MIVFPSYRYTYYLWDVVAITYSFGAASGVVIYIDYYTTKETYYLIILNQNVALGSTLYLNYIKNANDVLDFGPLNNLTPVDQGVIVRGYYW
jgi:hypothetical protein